MVYSFPVGGKPVNGLSKAGTWAVMRAYNKTAKGHDPFIVLSPVKDGLLTSSEDSYGFVANASLMNKEGQIFENAGGGSEASKKDMRGNKDAFALAKAVTKAQRNAIRALLPDDLVKKYIEKWTKLNKVKVFFSKSSTMNLNVGQPMFCDTSKGGCGRPLTPKAVAYYSSHPNVDRLCYVCNQRIHPKTI